MTVASIEIPLAEHFDDPLGRLANYDAYDSAQRSQVTKQRHVDLRTFKSGEAWSAGTVGVQADRNNWYGISASLGVGTTTLTSVIAAIDVSGMEPTDILSFALPAFPAADLDLTNCYVEFTSNASGDFTAGPTVAMSMSGLASGNVELSTPLGTLSPLEHRVTGVRFHLTATNACTFRCLAIRVLGADWEHAPLDIDTRSGALVRPVSRDGSLGAFAFPVNTFSDPQVPTDFPILFRSTTPSTTEDPRPIDLSQAVVFYTGQGNGDIRLIFREYAYDIVTQLDLDLYNSGTGITQQQLEAMGRQPDYDRALYLAKDQADLDNLPQSVLDGTSQYNLEAEPDYFTAAWIEVRIQWDDSGSTVTVRDTESNLYDFAGGIQADERYVALIELEGASLRVRVHPVDDEDVVTWGSTSLDTTVLTDDFIFARRSGRVGWYAQFTEGDAYLDSIRSYDANFAEYRSVPLRSITPVVGGQVFYGGSPPREYFTGVEGFDGASAAPDDSKSTSGKAYRIDAPADGVVQTNRAYIDNLRDAVVTFDLWFPPDADAASLEASLIDAHDNQYDLNLARLVPGRWQPYRLDLDVFNSRLLPGFYSFGLVLRDGDTAFYLDNISIRQPVLVWSGRAKTADPWNDDNTEWMSFRDEVNGHTAGALFSQSGFSAQVRAFARRQNADLNTVKFLPKYAELGRLVWDDEAPATVAPTITSYTATPIGANSVDFSVAPGDLTLGPGRFVVYYEWFFGDGHFATGPMTTHAYQTPGPYRTSLTIVDNQGERATRFQNVTVV